jgi:amino acid efflux transporter
MAELAKTLTACRGTAIMLNIVLGAGLLTLPGLAIGSVGAAAPLVWAACALASVPLLIVFARLGRRFPGSGGVASFAAEAFGTTGSGIATFLLFGAVILGLPSIALIGGSYVQALVPIDRYLAAALLLALAALPNLLAPGRSGRVQGLLATALLVFFCVVIIACAVALRGEVGTHSVTSPMDLPGLQAFISVFMMVFFAFTGWELGAGISAEFKNPARDFPLAIALSFAAVVTLYIGLTMLLLRIGLDASETAAPLATLTERALGTSGRLLVSLAAVVLVLANLAAAIWAVSRLVWSSATSGLLPAALAGVHVGAPRRAVAATLAALATALALSAALDIDLATYLEFAGQNFFVLYAVAALVLLARRDRTSDLVIGLVAILIVGILISLRSPMLLAYPALCIALGLLASWPARRNDRRKRANTRTALPGKDIAQREATWHV